MTAHTTPAPAVTYEMSAPVTASATMAVCFAQRDATSGERPKSAHLVPDLIFHVDFFVDRLVRRE